MYSFLDSQWREAKKKIRKYRDHFILNGRFEPLTPDQTDIARGGKSLLNPLVTHGAPVISDLLLEELLYILQRRQELCPTPIISAPQATTSHSQHCDLCHLLSCTCFAPSHYFPLLLLVHPPPPHLHHPVSITTSWDCVVF